MRSKTPNIITHPQLSPFRPASSSPSIRTIHPSAQVSPPRCAAVLPTRVLLISLDMVAANGTDPLLERGSFLLLLRQLVELIGVGRVGERDDRDLKQRLRLCPLRSGEVWSGRAPGRGGAGQSRAGRIGSDWDGAGRVRSGQIGSDWGGSGRVRSGQGGSGQIGAGRGRSGRVRSGQVGTGQIGARRCMTHQGSQGRAKQLRVSNSASNFSNTGRHVSWFGQVVSWFGRMAPTSLPMVIN